MGLAGYDKFFASELQNHILPEEEIKNSLSSIGNLPKPSIEKTGKW
jgi:hypothetical protein